MSSLVNLHSSSGHSRSNFLPSLAKLANSPFYQDVRIVCSDGVVVRWNRYASRLASNVDPMVFNCRFLLAANSSMLAKCLFDSWQSDEDDSVVVVPGLSSATLGTMLACTLNRAVRGDILSVNEQQAMGLLGFSLLNGSGEGQNIKDRRTQQYQQLLVSSKTLPPSKRMLSVEIQEEEDNDEEDTSDDGEMSSDESLDPTTLGQVTGESDLTQHESLCHQEGIVNDKSKFTQEDNVSTEFSDIPEVQDVGLDTISMSADLLEVEERSLLDNNISEEITEELTGNKLKHCGGTGPHDVNGAISDGKGLLVINGELDTDIENALEDSASVLDTPRREDEVVKLSNHAGGSVQDQDANNPFSPNNRSPSPRFKDKSHRARLVCPEPSCKLSFERAAHLEQHVAAHRNSSVGGFECGECGKRFFHMANLRAHERYHVDRALMLSCPHCEKTFKGKRVLANHVKSAHFLAKCPHCDEEMPRNRLNGHLREVHQVKRVKKSDSDEDPDHRTYACEFCKKKFSTPNALMHHRRVHDGDPPPEELEPIGEDATGSCVRWVSLEKSTIICDCLRLLGVVYANAIMPLHVICGLTSGVITLPASVRSAESSSRTWLLTSTTFTQSNGSARSRGRAAQYAPKSSPPTTPPSTISRRLTAATQK